MKTLTKKDRRQQELLRHYAMLERLASWLGINPVKSGKLYSNKLRQLEAEARSLATHYCNGTGGIDSDNWDEKTEPILNAIKELFGGKEIPGLFVNGDARGYALKISDETVARLSLRDRVGITTDWGGYGILSPEIE